MGSNQKKDPSEIYRWGWLDRSRGDKLFWKTGIYGVAMRGGL